MSGQEKPAAAGAGSSLRGSGLVLGFAASFPAAATWLWFVVLAGNPLMRPVYGLAKLIQFALPAVWVFGAERRHAAQAARARSAGGGTGPARPARDAPGAEAAAFPVPARRWGAGIGPGLLFGAAASGLILVAYFALLRGTGLLGPGPAEIRAKVGQLGLATPARFLALALFYSLAHSGLEEYYWRWFVFGRLRRLLPERTSIVLSSLAFTAHHIIVLAIYFRGAWWMTLLASAAVFAGGRPGPVSTGGADRSRDRGSATCWWTQPS